MSVAAGDRDKLDEYLTSVRELEQRLGIETDRFSTSTGTLTGLESRRG